MPTAKRNWLERILDRLFTRHDIGKNGDVYLTRWDVFNNRFGRGHKIFIHLFHRGDADKECHNHPWSFWSLILAGGYWEWTPGYTVHFVTQPEVPPLPTQVKKWYGPGSFLRRPFSWCHRVELPAGKRCWTLVWTSPKKQSWGFLCPDKGIVPWREYLQRQEAGMVGCGEDIAQ